MPARLDGDARRTAVRRALVRWYKLQAERWLVQRTQHWARVGGFIAGPVIIRDQRQRWGSYAPNGTFRFNWRIVMAPSTLLDYVVVHELCHLRVTTHSSAFWTEVAKLLPDYAQRRTRLKQLGPTFTL